MKHTFPHHIQTEWHNFEHSLNDWCVHIRFWSVTCIFVFTQSFTLHLHERIHIKSCKQLFIVYLVPRATIILHPSRIFHVYNCILIWNLKQLCWLIQSIMAAHCCVRNFCAVSSHVAELGAVNHDCLDCWFFISISKFVHLYFFRTMAATIMETSNRISNGTENSVWIYCASNLFAFNICWKMKKKWTRSWMCLQKSLSQQNVFQCFLCIKCFICVAISRFFPLRTITWFLCSKREIQIQAHHTDTKMLMFIK